jgi:hypothetical protein
VSCVAYANTSFICANDPFACVNEAFVYAIDAFVHVKGPGGTACGGRTMVNMVSPLRNEKAALRRPSFQLVSIGWGTGIYLLPPIIRIPESAINHAKIL